MRTERDTYVEDTLRGIEQSVLHEVRIRPGWRTTASVAATTLGLAAVCRWWSAGAAAAEAHGGGAVVSATTAIFLLAALVTTVAVRLPRFRWCCAAACTSWFASVTGMAALWWHRTAPAPDSLVWTLICALAVVVLTATWLAVVLTPLEESQPDMAAKRNVDR